LQRLALADFMAFSLFGTLSIGPLVSIAEAEVRELEEKVRIGVDKLSCHQKTYWPNW
jgi:hypothetical protein